MGDIPVLKPSEVEAILLKLGFAMVRQRGSHRQYRHADGRCTTVPFHAGRDISPILLRQIAKDISMTVEELIRYRWISTPPPTATKRSGATTPVESGILLLPHRYLDPTTGRFLTRDPIGLEGGVNLYAYVGNNPVNEDDPSGYQRQYKPKPPKQGDSGKYQHCISEGIQKHCKGVGVSDNTLYAWAWCIIYAESSWNPEARSDAGAIGCMQIMPVNDKKCKKAGYPN